MLFSVVGSGLITQLNVCVGYLCKPSLAGVGALFSVVPYTVSALVLLWCTGHIVYKIHGLLQRTDTVHNDYIWQTSRESSAACNGMEAAKTAVTEAAQPVLDAAVSAWDGYDRLDMRSKTKVNRLLFTSSSYLVLGLVISALGQGFPNESYSFSASCFEGVINLIGWLLLDGDVMQEWKLALFS
jgi:hypothetical protein